MIFPPHTKKAWQDELSKIEHQNELLARKRLGYHHRSKEARYYNAMLGINLKKIKALVAYGSAVEWL